MDAPGKDGYITQFGPFELDLKNAELRRKGARIPIQPAALKLLQVLVSRPGELIPRAEIHKQLWPEEKVTKTESLDLRLNFEIKTLREALADDHVKPRYIQTVRKRGYRFIAPVEIRTIEEEPTEVIDGNHRDFPKPGTPRGADPGGRWNVSPVRNALTVALTVLGIGLVLLFLRPQASSPPVITWVSPILPHANQTIIIRGNDLGSYTNFTGIDSPFLAIRDNTAHWAAGRIMERNWDKVTLTVARWLNSEILVTGFCGSYGQNGWELKPGDEIEVAVWNPQTGAGPALYYMRVSREAGER